MPGIAGFTSGEMTMVECDRVLKQMQVMITHFHGYVKDALYTNGAVCATRSHINIVQKEQQPFHESGCYVWLDGEFYNQAQFTENKNKRDKSDPKILLDLFEQEGDIAGLNIIDGTYAAVIYDSVNQKVHLISDRHGMRFLFWTVHRGHLAWSSELKAMLALPGFKPKIDLQAVGDFFQDGFIREDRTWFEQVKLLSPGTVLTWDIKLKMLHKRRYWGWEEIKPLEGRLDENEIAEELGRLFKDAVQKRCRDGERIGLGLSGGLDSRAVIAAIPDEYKPLHVLTFGKKGGSEIAIAQKVAKLKGANHHLVEIDSANWLAPRINGVWRTDGMMNLKHMHGIESHSICHWYDIGLGGQYARLLKGNHFQKTDDEITLFYNSERRFINSGPILAGWRKVIRTPFLDNNLFSMTVSLPRRIRLNMNIHTKFLLAAFPEFFYRIPYQKFGVPIGSHPYIRKLSVRFRELRIKLLKGAARLGLEYSNPYTYTDYPNWIRKDPAKSFFENVLMGANTLYPEYIAADNVRIMMHKQMEGEDFSEDLCRCFTFELWLQQVFEGQYREADDDI